jgi:FAD binding domain
LKKRNRSTSDSTSERADSTAGRREFFTKAGLAAAGATVGGLTAGQPAVAKPGSADAIHWDHEVDVVVAGSGNGGISAALAAAQAGAKTLVVEFSTQIGGNTLMSGGIMHTAGQRTWEDYNKYTQGLHDPVLAKVYVETFWNEYVPWLLSLGAYMSRRSPEIPGFHGDWWLGKGEPGQLRHKLYFDSLVKPYQAAGGTFLMQTRVTQLHTDADGRVIGLRARTWKDSPRDENQRWVNIKARKTIMAIGGWIMDGERKARYLGQDGAMSQQYCGPFSSGEGLDICQKVGVGMSKSGWSTFSGGACAMTGTSLMNASMDEMFKLWKEVPPEEWTPTYFRGRNYPPRWVNSWPQFGHACRGILVNNAGQRFIDEASPVLARYPRVQQAIARQPRGYAWTIADQAIHEATPGSQEALKRVVDEGGILGTHGNVIIADTLKDFADALAAAGMYRGAFLKTIEDYNRAVDEGKQEDLAISHFTGQGSGGFAIRKPPFYAVPLRAHPYMMFGGLRMNEFAQALDPQGVPIQNLYVPPPLGGGIQNEIYTGAIACAGTFGHLAARHAVKAIGK